MEKKLKDFFCRLFGMLIPILIKVAQSVLAGRNGEQKKMMVMKKNKKKKYRQKKNERAEYA